MRLLLTALILFLFNVPDVYSQKVTFDYDESGNQKERRWECLNCTPLTSFALSSAEQLNEKKANEITSEESKAGTLSVYPNPVVSNLNVNWKPIDEIYIKKVEVYNVGGWRVHSQSFGKNQREVSLPFSHLGSGSYLLIVHYSNSKSEVIRLTKIQ